jgi:hypothetical protein
MASRGRGRKGYIEEPFAPTIITEDWFYYFPKIVGTSKYSNKALNPSVKRHAIIANFFENNSDRYSLQHIIEDVRATIVDSLKKDGFLDFGLFPVSKMVFLVPEPNNIYDPNAISVEIIPWWDEKSILTTRPLDVGYIPAGHASILTKDFPIRYVVGVEKDGRGMRIHIILGKRNCNVADICSEKSNEAFKLEVPKFLSLKKIRKQLEV